MEKQKVMQAFEASHQKMADVIQKLSKEQMVKEKVLDDWSVKDILAHLSAWSWEAIKEIDRVLQNKATWHKLFEKKGEDKFNKREVAKRKKRSLEKIIDEWEKSFQAEMARVEKLTKREWLHQSNRDKWRDGRPVTVFSLYGYEYQGEDHEAAHAKQIREYFDLD